MSGVLGLYRGQGSCCLPSSDIPSLTVLHHGWLQKLTISDWAAAHNACLTYCTGCCRCLESLSLDNCSLLNLKLSLSKLKVRPTGC